MAQPPRGLVGHCTSGRPLNPPLVKNGKDTPLLVKQRMVPELIPVLGS